MVDGGYDLASVDEDNLDQVSVRRLSFVRKSRDHKTNEELLENKKNAFIFSFTKKKIEVINHVAIFSLFGKKNKFASKN